MSAPLIPNLLSPVPVVLVDPVSGLPYRIGSAPVVSHLPIPNLSIPIGSVAVNPTTGALYKIA